MNARILLAIPLLLVAGSLYGQKGRVAAYRELVEGVKGWTTVSLSGATISNLVIRRDAGTFILKSGTIALLPSIGSKVIGAWFEGEGRFTMTPPTFVEREQLERFTKRDSADESFNRLLLIFTDSTAAEIERMIKGTPVLPMPRAGELIARALKYATNEKTGDLFPPLVASWLNGCVDPVFDASMIVPDEAERFFTIDPEDVEEVQYFDRDPDAMFVHVRRQINSFHSAAEHAQGKVNPRESKDRASILAYRIDATLRDNLTMAVRADVRMKRRQSRSSWIAVWLHPGLLVDSILGPGGVHVDYVQTLDGIIWLQTIDGVLTFHYQGRVIEREGDWILLTSSIGWYPHYGYTERAGFDLTFHTPVSYPFVSVGRLLSSGEADGVRTTHWVTDREIRNASFHIGVSSVDRYTNDSLPTLIVLRGPESSKGISESIASDIHLSMGFFRNLFGKLDVDTFYAGEIPAGHGEAFPGMIHLSSWTFGRNRGTGEHEAFRAHEVAHQWWGIELDFATYHDQWLSEAFAEYSALMYMQAVMKDNDRFFERLKKYREEILSIRKVLFGSRRPPGPIWLGRRNDAGVSGSDYFPIIYRKGAWVLHMLRNMLLDLNTMKEDRFTTMMRDFFLTYQGRDATTEDFQRIAEKHVGVSLGWFFDQWVKGTGIPTYHWSWTSEPAEEGRYRLILKVRQEGVPSTFQMYIPIRVDFGDGKLVRFRVQIKGETCEPAIPLMPLKPRKVIFNDLESVLCETEEE